MNRINFTEVNMLSSLVTALDEALSAMPGKMNEREEAVRLAARKMLEYQAEESLVRIPVEALSQSKAGIRVQQMEEAGYKTLEDLARADDETLLAVNGVGEKQVSSIRTAIASFRQQIIKHKTVRLSLGVENEQNEKLIHAAAVCRMSREITKDAFPVREAYHSQVTGILPAIRLNNRLKWLFSGRKAKETTLEAIEKLTRFASSSLYERAGMLHGRFHELDRLSQEDARKDFEQHSAEYYILLEELSGKQFPTDSGTFPGVSSMRGLIPEELAMAVDEIDLHMECFRGSLRAYQKFGVKYILHQKRVLLGDDMGLGKTIQAIAAMSHMYASEKNNAQKTDKGMPEKDDAPLPVSRFLVICPAGVLINWMREIRKFSSIPAYLIHGKNKELEFEKWLTSGGIAVTNYETVKRIIDRINDKTDISMLVVDEAHYIKNPRAMRTRHIRMMDDEAARILLMTGTPLENHVMEMCSLIDFIRPDLAPQVREAAALSHTQEFGSLISPVYLRRRRKDVLQELPPVEMKEEWCAMTQEDRDEYAAQILDRNFTGARRVGFLQEDMETSSKAQRLMELCMEAKSAGRKVILYSYFRETIHKASEWLKERCVGVITGDTASSERQEIVDRFFRAPEGSVLACQVQAGGTGLNIQAASIVIFCEPQIKPSLMNQAISRSWRMGQVRNVQVHHLLCDDTVDEVVLSRLEEKQTEFDLYAEESPIARAAEELADTDWIKEFMEKERSRYLPAVV